MHVVITCPYSIDIPGGVQGQVIGMAKTLSARHRVTILAPGTMIPESLRSTPVEMILLGASLRFRANGSVAPISLSLPSAARLQGFLALAVPDVLIIHEPMVPLVSIAALLGSAKMKIGVFHRGGPTRALSLLRPLAAVLLKKLDDGIVVSEEARASVHALIGDGSRSFRRIPNAVDTARFAPREQGERQRGSILFVGRHEPRKGLSVLLRAYSRLGSGYSLSIVGDGPETAELMRRYSSATAIQWLGRVSDNEIAGLMHHCEIFVAPSMGGESFGVVLLEAMAAEVPVLCSDIPGYRLAADDAARYFPPGDFAELAVAIESLSVDDKARRELVRRGRERSAEFDFSVASKRYLDVIRARLPEEQA